MKARLQAHLHASPEQAARLKRLQTLFAQACNAIAPQAQQTRCWNRVALHHMVYRTMREQFPELGSQMVCNAIYAVSRTCRIVYQHPASPFHVDRSAATPLPVIQFSPEAPVYFDRHTLSIKDGRASLYTLDGRMHFEIKLPPEDLARLAAERVREIVLTGRGAQYTLSFVLDAADAEDDPPPTEPRNRPAAAEIGRTSETPWPGYVQIVAPRLATREPASTQELR